MPKIAIAMPTVNRSVHSETVTSVVQMVARLERRGIATGYVGFDGADIVTARDGLSHLFLSSDSTHLLFVDSDMVFDAGLCEQLLERDKPLVAAAYTTRSLDLQRAKALVEQGEQFDDAIARAYQFILRYEDGGTLTVERGTCRVAGVGMGFALIARECLARLLSDGNLPMATTGQRALGKQARPSFFAHLDGMSEDFSFCERYRRIGGEVWVYIDAAIKHAGDFKYGVPLGQRLALARKLQPQTHEPAAT